MNHYHAAKICLNGDMITDSIETSIDDSEFCIKCGAKIISECPNCHASIHGFCDIDGILTFETTQIPAYCHACGAPYPWTEARLKAAENIINMLDELSDVQKKKLVDFIPDITAETPRSQYAALVYAKSLECIQGLTIECFKIWAKENVLPTLLILMNMQK